MQASENAVSFTFRSQSRRCKTPRKYPSRVIVDGLTSAYSLQKNGLVAQLVEQRTENPCVGGSIPPQATSTGALFYSENSLSHTISYALIGPLRCASQLAVREHGNMTANGPSFEANHFEEADSWGVSFLA
jgi:hypothetical protein